MDYVNGADLLVCFFLLQPEAGERDEISSLFQYDINKHPGVIFFSLTTSSHNSPLVSIQGVSGIIDYDDISKIHFLSNLSL